MNLNGYETLKLTLDRAILTVTLDRPDVKNAANALMERELCRAFTEVNEDPAIRVVVLTGAGSTFSGGGDFAYMKQMIDEPSQMWNALPTAKRVIFSLLDCSRPVVAKINGHAIGLGATLALFCDVSFMAENARLSDPHVAIGFVAGDGGAVIWPQLIGYARAKEYLFTGDPIGARDAERMGLVNHSVPPEELDATVLAFANRLCNMPARALQWTKSSVNIGLKQLAHSILDSSIAYEALSNLTADHREALQAIAEKRKPTFTGD